MNVVTLSIKHIGVGKLILLTCSLTLLLSACDSRESKIKTFCDDFKENKRRMIAVIDNSINDTSPDNLRANEKIVQSLKEDIVAKSKKLLAEGIDVSNTKCD